MTKIISESDLRHYAVAIPFIDEANLLFEVRSENISHQPGDICFPGGAVENGENPKEAVMRELMEELLVHKDQIELEEENFILVSSETIIHCFPCHIRNYEDGYSPEEVKEVFCVPLTFLKNTSAKVYEVNWNPVFPDDFPFEKIYGGRNYGWRPQKSRIRFYEYQGRVIWGMTARIIEGFVKETGRDTGL